MDADDHTDPLPALTALLHAHQPQPGTAEGAQGCACGNSSRDHDAHQAEAILASAWYATIQQASANRVGNRVRAAVRLISPEHITPLGARQLNKVLDEEAPDPGCPRTVCCLENARRRVTC